jgi:hypothetical protein
MIMLRCPSPLFLLRFWGLTFFAAVVLASAVAGQDSGALSVRSEVGPGPYFVGQGFEVRIAVVAGGQRLKIDPPRIAGARTSVIGTERRPITTTTIGSVVAHETLFVVRFRVVPERAGTLDIPAVQVQIKNRSGRSRPRSVSIRTVPLLGRPAEFLGGVGRFELQAEAAPKVVRVGQELDFRIKVTGPAAWGMTDRPDMGRFGRLELGLRIEPKPVESTDEPPARTFVYRLRPTRAGDAILPPVAIAAFDPSLSRYVPHVTAGVPIRVVAVPAFDPTSVHYDPPSTAMSRPVLISVMIASLAVLSSAAYLIQRGVRRRLARPRPFSPDLACRFARQTARYLGSLSVEHRDESSTSHACVALLNLDGPEFNGNLFQPSTWYPSSKPTILQAGSPEIVQSAARRIYERLASYLLLGTGQSVGVLTPEEARQGVASLTSSSELAAQAGELTAWCDSILYGDLTGEAAMELRKLIDDARRLFEALGRVTSSRGQVSN